MNERIFIKEAADILNISNSNMLRVYASRYGVGVKVGKEWTFTLEDIKLINSKRRDPVDLQDLPKIENEIKSTLDIDKILKYAKKKVESIAKGESKERRDKWFFEGKTRGFISVVSFLSKIPEAGESLDRSFWVSRFKRIVQKYKERNKY